MSASLMRIYDQLRYELYGYQGRRRGHHPAADYPAFRGPAAFMTEIRPPKAL